MPPVFAYQLVKTNSRRRIMFREFTCPPITRNHHLAGRFFAQSFVDRG